MNRIARLAMGAAMLAMGASLLLAQQPTADPRAASTRTSGNPGQDPNLTAPTGRPGNSTGNNNPATSGTPATHRTTRKRTTKPPKTRRPTTAGKSNTANSKRMNPWSTAPAPR